MPGVAQCVRGAMICYAVVWLCHYVDYFKTKSFRQNHARELAPLRCPCPDRNNDAKTSLADCMPEEIDAYETWLGGSNPDPRLIPYDSEDYLIISIATLFSLALMFGVLITLLVFIAFIERGFPFNLLCKLFLRKRPSGLQGGGDAAVHDGQAHGADRGYESDVGDVHSHTD